MINLLQSIFHMAAPASAAGNRLVVGTTTPEVAPGGIPAFLADLKSHPRYQSSVFVEWSNRASDRHLSFGRFDASRLRRFVASQLRLLRLLSRFDEIEVHSLRTGLGAVLLCPQRCVFFYHGPGFQEAAVEGAGTWKRAMLFLIENALLPRVPTFRTASHAFKLRLRENHGIDLERITILRPRLEFTRSAYEAALRGKLAEAERTGIVTAVICRRLVQRVGVLEFLAEFRSSPEYTHVRLKIVGAGPLAGQTEEACSKDHRVEWLGAISDAERDAVYADAVFNIVPSLHLEGLGMVIYEGAMRGAIPLTLSCGGMPELIDELGIGKTFATTQALLSALSLETVHAELAGRTDLHSRKAACR